MSTNKRRWLSAGIALALAGGVWAGAVIPPEGLVAGSTSAGLSGDQSVPFSFPGERSGLPVPVSLVQSGSAFGHGGLGWSLPLSVVEVVRSEAGRRPESDGSVRPRVSLSLMGSAVSLVATNAAGTEYQARQGGETLVLRQVSLQGGDPLGVVWELTTTSGQRYWFARINGTFNGDRPDEGRWYLTEIRDVSSDSRMELDYDYETWVPGEFEVLLRKVRYNFAGACAKHEVRLGYRRSVPAEVAAEDTAGTKRWVRKVARPDGSTLVVSQLLDAVEVMAAGDAGSCSYERLSRYELGYQEPGANFEYTQDDPGYRTPRLESVRMSGRVGTASVPLVRYEYGRDGSFESEAAASVLVFPTSGHPQLQEPGGDHRAPFVTVSSVFHGVEGDSTAPPATGLIGPLREMYRGLYQYGNGDVGEWPEMRVSSAMAQFQDFTGDGIADYVYVDRVNGEDVVKIAHGRLENGQLALSSQPVPLFAYVQGKAEGDMLPVALTQTVEMRSWPTGVMIDLNLGTQGVADLTATWVDVIDVNADGRPDVLDARYPDRWTVYINMPGDDPSFPTSLSANDVKWRAVHLDMGAQRSALQAKWTAAVDPDLFLKPLGSGSNWPMNLEHLPLSVTVSSPEWIEYKCIETAGSAPNGLCDGIYGLKPVLSSAPERYSIEQDWGDAADVDPYFTPGQPSAKTVSVTPWKLADMNGDGYVDLVSSFGFTAKQDQGTWEAWGVKSCEEASLGDLEPHCWFDESLPGYGYVNATAKKRYTARGVRETEQKQPFEVFYNQRGTRLTDATALFLDQPKVWAQGECAGVEVWRSDKQGSTRMECGLTDANGDGFVDLKHRADDTSATSWALLGNGVEFTQAMYESEELLRDQRRSLCGLYQDPTLGGWLRLPPQLGGLNGHVAGVAGGTLDWNGDGLRDMWTYDASSQETYWTAGSGAMLTGVTKSKRPGRALATGEMMYSSITESPECGSNFNDPGEYFPDGYRPLKTVDVLADVNGDGHPERIEASEEQPGVWFVRERVGVDGQVPYGYGRITAVVTAHGARTEYTYGSAKALDPVTPHQVPFPEVVVTQVRTRTPEQVLAPVQYAYGDIRMRYDALSDRFVPTGYARTVVTQKAAANAAGSTQLTDRYGPADFAYDHPFSGGAPTARTTNADTEYNAHALIGRVKDAYQFSYGVSDPWALLGGVLLPGNASGQTHYEYTVVWDKPTASPAWASAAGCKDVEQSPYAQQGAAHSDAPGYCNWIARTYAQSTESWTGEQSPDAGDRNVQTGTEVAAVDGDGRPTLIHRHGDLRDATDDVCERLTYAEATGEAEVRRLGLVARREVLGCASGWGESNAVLAKTEMIYDGQAVGLYTQGRLTGSKVYRYDTETGVLLESYQAGEVAYRADGLVDHVMATNGGVSRTTQFTYDAFGLVPVEVSTSASDVPGVSLWSRTVPDPITLAPLEVHDMYGGKALAEYDGYGRLLRQSVVSADDATPMTVQSLHYYGDDGSEPRRVVSRSFRTWREQGEVAAEEADGLPGALAAGESRSLTVFDALGRVDRTETYLGADYGNAVIHSGAVTYDDLGRVVYTTQPTATGQAASDYGMTYFYDPQGRWQCAVAGTGVQTLAPSDVHEGIELPQSDRASERVAGCQSVSYANGEQVLRQWGASELDPAEAAYGAYGEVLSSGSGRMREQRRVQDGTVIERTRFGYNGLGQATSIRRYREADTATGVVEWTMAYDSLGQRLRLREPQTATQSTEYDWWGQPTAVTWVDGGVDHAVLYQYDGLGRLQESYATRNGQREEATRTRHVYDAGSQEHPYEKYLVGRLAYSEAFDEDGELLRRVYAGYDGLGRSRGAVEEDAQGQRYAQEVEFEGPAALSLLRAIQPNGAIETLSYTYDSAGRVVRTQRTDTDGNPVANDDMYISQIDAFGRVGEVHYGNGTREQYTYATSGRELLMQVELSLRGPNGGSPMTRTTRFGYDTQGRVRVRDRQDAEGTPGPLERSMFDYDALHRLIRSEVTEGGQLQEEERFGYDGLGNLSYRFDALTNQSQVAYPLETDLDRVCATEAVTGEPNGLPMARSQGECTYVYDARGALTQRASDGLEVSYDGLGRVTALERGALMLTYRHGLGGIAEVQSNLGADRRQDRRFAGFEESLVNGVPTLSRYLGGVELRGEQALYAHGDDLGGLTVSNGNGNQTQRTRYSAYGRPLTQTSAPGSAGYSKYQYNGGDYLADFGVSQLGARLYDPALGRFLSRDPLLVPRTSAVMNPYGFAFNDPVNFADPSGLDPFWTEGGFLRDILGDTVTQTESGVNDGFEAAQAIGDALAAGAANGWQTWSERHNRILDLAQNGSWVERLAYSPYRMLNAGGEESLMVLGKVGNGEDWLNRMACTESGCIERALMNAIPGGGDDAVLIGAATLFGAMRTMGRADDVVDNAKRARTFKPGKKHLDIGSGDGNKAIALAKSHPSSEVVGLELGSDELGVWNTDLAKRKAGIHRAPNYTAIKTDDGAGSLVKYPAFRGKFDSVSLHSPNLWIDQSAIAKQADQLLKPGGQMLIVVEKDAQWLERMSAAASLLEGRGYGVYVLDGPETVRMIAPWTRGTWYAPAGYLDDYYNYYGVILTKPK